MRRLSCAPLAACRFGPHIPSPASTCGRRRSRQVSQSSCSAYPTGRSARTGARPRTPAGLSERSRRGIPESAAPESRILKHAKKFSAQIEPFPYRSHVAQSGCDLVGQEFAPEREFASLANDARYRPATDPCRLSPCGFDHGTLSASRRAVSASRRVTSRSRLMIRTGTTRQPNAARLFRTSTVPNVRQPDEFGSRPFLR